MKEKLNAQNLRGQSSMMATGMKTLPQEDFERAGLWRKVKAEGKHESRKRNKYSEGKKHICNKLIRL